ncbi:MAG: ribosome biogenesis GTPase Der [Prevotellaceae bacterium]|jgi:GTP-binding protein|nr:ribosome biogenesis GTPase Der [Prevotellaceae bacterium]
MGNILAIVGRPNVGKSTLFNRLVGMRQAIVDETSGVTRDRHYGKSDWNGIEFSVIDTGGYATNTEDIFEEEIRKQVHLAIDEADAIVFMVDVATGITDFDDTVADILRRIKKKVFLVVNKVDNNNRVFDSNVFYKLGLGAPYCVSSISGSGTGDLLDDVVKCFDKNNNEQNDDKSDELPRIAVVGKPNVGKSSLTNALLDEERNIVTPIAGTTRDSIETKYKKFDFDFFLVDTAGLRKRNKVTEDLEFYSVMRSIRSIENSDVCILMMDATQGVEAQDMSIYNLIIKNKKGCVIVVNKWDLVEKETNTMRDYKKKVIDRIAPFTDVPVIFVSVINKQRIYDVLQTAVKVAENRKRKIVTRQLNDVLLPIIEGTPPPANKGKYIKVKYITQLASPTPTFAFFCNLPQYIKEPYKRFLENRLRENFEFTGCPIQLFFRQK